MLGKQDWRYVSGGGQVVHDAHAPGYEITSLAFARDANTMLSRCADGTLKASVPTCLSRQCKISVTSERVSSLQLAGQPPVMSKDERRKTVWRK